MHRFVVQCIDEHTRNLGTPRDVATQVAVRGPVDFVITVETRPRRVLGLVGLVKREAAAYIDKAQCRSDESFVAVLLAPVHFGIARLAFVTPRGGRCDTGAELEPGSSTRPAPVKVCIQVKRAAANRPAARATQSTRMADDFEQFVDWVGEPEQDANICGQWLVGCQQLRPLYACASIT